MSVLCPRASQPILPLLVALWITTPCVQSAEKNVAPIEIRPSWKTGDIRSYERIKTRRQIVSGKETTKKSGRSIVDVKIAEASQKGYIVRWSYGQTRVDDPEAAQNPLARAMMNIINSMKIMLELDKNSAITGVQNWKELKTTAAAMGKAFTENPEAKGLDQATADRLRTMVTSMYSSKEQIEQAFTHEPQLFFFPLGRTYELGKSHEYDDHLPNPLGGEPLPCQGRVSLKSYNKATGRALVTWTQTVDPEVAQKVILETLKTMGKQLGRTAPPNPDEFKNFSVADHAEFIVDAKSGWLEEFSHTHVVKTGNSTREDILEMKVRKSR